MTKIQLRHDTSDKWQTANPILAPGEVAIETDTLKMKAGNGSTAYNSLMYIGTTRTTNETDMNNITEPGTYYFSSARWNALTNKPDFFDVTIAWLSVISFNGGNVIQIMFSGRASAVYSQVALRQRVSNSWNNWLFITPTTSNQFNKANGLVQLDAGGRISLSGDIITQGKLKSNYITDLNNNRIAQQSSGTIILGSTTSTGLNLLGNDVLYNNNPTNGANGLVKLDEAGKLPAIDGSQLINLPSGTGSENMVTTDTTQSISGEKTFTSQYTKFKQDASTGVGLAIKTSTNTNTAYIVPIRKDGSIPTITDENYISLGAAQNATGIKLSAKNQSLELSGSVGIQGIINGRKYSCNTNYERLSGAGNGGDDRNFTIYHSQSNKNGVEYEGVFFANDPGYSSFKVGDFNSGAVSNNEFVHIFDNPTDGTMGISFNTTTKDTVIKTPKDNLTIARGATYQEYNNVDSGNIEDYVPTGTLRYWTGTEADYSALETKDADTLYRTTDTNKVFLGTIQLGG